MQEKRLPHFHSWFLIMDTEAQVNHFQLETQMKPGLLELIAKGPGKKGAVWVARRIPDGYISGHANHPRITHFPLADGVKSITSKELDKINNPEVETVYAYDVIDVARSFGWFSGDDKDFSFSDTYAPLDFSGAQIL